MCVCRGSQVWVSVWFNEPRRAVRLASHLFQRTGGITGGGGDFGRYLFSCVYNILVSLALPLACSTLCYARTLSARSKSCWMSVWGARAVSVITLRPAGDLRWGSSRGAGVWWWWWWCSNMLGHHTYIHTSTCSHTKRIINQCKHRTRMNAKSIAHASSKPLFLVSRSLSWMNHHHRRTHHNHHRSSSSRGWKLHWEVQCSINSSWFCDVHGSEDGWMDLNSRRGAHEALLWRCYVIFRDVNGRHASNDSNEAT